MSWTDDDPGAGDVEALRSAGRSLDSATRILSGARTDVASEIGTLTDAAWSGQAGDAWRRGAETCARDLGGLVEAAAAGSTALVQYASTVDEISADAVAVRARQAEARADLALLLQKQARPTIIPPGTVQTPREKRLEETKKREARDSAHDAISDADAEMAELVARRRAADQVVREALGGVSIADWAELGQVSVRAGLDSPGKVGGDGTSGVLVSLVQDVLDGNGSMEDLTQLVDAWSGDEQVLSRLFLSLGGEGTAALIDLLSSQVYAGKIDEDVARRQAEVLLGAISVASAGWTSAQACRFTEQMTGHLRWAGVAGFLFSSAQVSPMGEAFTVAVADALDSLERAEGRVPAWYPGGGHVLANLMFPDHPGRGADPMSGVLETLGVYPRSAVDWLMDGQDEPPFDRISYWVKERDWSRDGFHGVTALWSGIQSLLGGPLDSEYDPAAWDALARVNTAFGAGLVENPRALPENFSVEAQVHLGVALSQMMHLLSYGFDMDRVAPSDGRFDYVRAIFWVNEDGGGGLEQRAVPVLDRVQVASLFGLASSSPEGRDVLTGGVRHVQQGILDIALLTPAAVDDALYRVSKLQAMLDGALDGSVEGTVARAGEQVAQIVDRAFSIISLVPIPGAGKASAKIADAANGIVVDKAAQWVADRAIGTISDAAKERVQEAIRSVAMDGAGDRARGSTWAASTEGAQGVEPGTRDSLTTTLREWVDMLDMSESFVLIRQMGNIDHYLDSITGDYNGIYERAFGVASGAR